MNGGSEIQYALVGRLALLCIFIDAYLLSANMPAVPRNTMYGLPLYKEQDMLRNFISGSVRYEGDSALP
jgi:hypothetical protein